MGRRLTPSCTRAGAQATGDVPLFDPDDERFLRRGDMPALIAAACERRPAAPHDRGETVRAILVSLACKYRLRARAARGASTGRERAHAST